MSDTRATEQVHRLNAGPNLHHFIGANANLVIEVWVDGDEFILAVRALTLGDRLDITTHEHGDWSADIRGRVENSYKGPAQTP